METEPAVFKPPYLSFQTFWNFIEELGAKPLPPQIDRSLMGSKSGTDQNSLTAALTTFDLIGPGGVVKERLKAMSAADPEARKQLLSELVRQHYAAAISVSDSHGTEQQLHEAFKDAYGMSAGETRRKSMTFFLHAARTAAIPLSANFRVTRSGSGAPGAPRPKKAAAKKKGSSGGSGNGSGGRQDSTPPMDEEYELSVTLQTGGTMSLSVNVNPLKLRGEDRAFFYDVVDRLTDYQSEHPDSQSSSEAGS